MRVIKLNMKRTNNKDVYYKTGLVIFENSEEYKYYAEKIKALMYRPRKKRVYRFEHISTMLPYTDIELVYIEYRAPLRDLGWEEDILDFLSAM